MHNRDDLHQLARQMRGRGGVQASLLLGAIIAFVLAASFGRR